MGPDTFLTNQTIFPAPDDFSKGPDLESDSRGSLSKGFSP